MDLNLPAELQDAFERWVEGTSARALESLTFPEIRKGVQALSSLYVERRKDGRVAERSMEGRGKRAAFASYYAPLHFLTTAGVVQQAGEDFLMGVSRVHDLGCGTGAAGAAVAGLAPQRVEVRALDRSGWAIAEAKRSYQAFGTPARAKRGAMPRDFPRKCGSGDLLVLGWLVNELAAEERESVLANLVRSVEAGARVLLMEPLSGAVSPWWSEWLPRFQAVSVRDGMGKWQIDRPAWLAKMDKASLLDHRSVGARYLVG